VEGGIVDPACAVGTLLDFAALHPADFPARGTFFIKQTREGGSDAIFGTADLAGFKLQSLVSWGLEVGVQPVGEGTLDSMTAEAAQEALALAQVQLAPLLPGYNALSIALPDDQPPQNAELLRGGTSAGQTYAYQGAVLPDAGLAGSPFMPNFDSYKIPRLPAGEIGGVSWRTAVGASEIFVSAGE